MSFFLPFITGAVVGSVVTWSADRFKPKLPDKLKLGWFSRLRGSKVVAGSTADGVESAAAVADTAAAMPDSPQTSVPPSTVADTAAATPDSSPTPIPQQLEDIKGIGPIYASRLREAGIATFAALAVLTPERVMDILSPDGSEGRLIQADDWIAQARELSGQTAS